MNWIIFLATHKIPYYVYKLNKGDSIIFENKEKSNQHIIIILEGIISLAKVFCNSEMLPLAILARNNIIDQDTIDKSYYKITALKTTYIIKLREKNLYKKKINYLDEHNIIKYYKKTITRYEETISIINQKNTTRRVTLFLLFIFLRFGHIKEYKIKISFTLSKECISIMTGTNIETINKIIRTINLDKKTKINLINVKKLKLI